MKIIKKVFLIILFVSLIFGCDIFGTPDNYKPAKSNYRAGYGNVSVDIGVDGADIAAASNMRTILPSILFEKYVYTFTKRGEVTGEIKTPVSGYFNLAVGFYTVKVDAYLKATDAEPTAYGISYEFEVVEGSVTEVQVLLKLYDEVEEGGEDGFFKYHFKFPVSHIAEVSLVKWPSGTTTLAFTSGTLEDEISGKQALPSGSYMLSVSVSNGSDYAGISDVIHIYPTLTTEYEKIFTNEDLMAPSYRIALSVNNIDFGTESHGYTPFTAREVTVFNMGNMPTGNLSIVSETSPSDFVFSTSALPSIARGKSAVFTVKPKDGLDTGIYEETVNVSGSNGIIAKLDVYFIVGNKKFSSDDKVDVKITSPIRGAKAKNAAEVNAATNDPRAEVTSIVWSPALETGDLFKEDVKYTATVIVTPADGYEFDNPPGENILTINGQPPDSITRNPDGTLTFTYEFNECQQPNVENIVIKTQPTKLIYNHGDTLDLTGLVVTINYTDASEVPPADVVFNPSTFTTSGFLATPSHGTQLVKTRDSNPVHDGATVQITFGGKPPVTTSAITVNKRNVTISAATITAKTFDGNVSIALPDVTSVSFSNVALGETITSSSTNGYTVTSASYTDNANAANGKPASIAVSLSGDCAANYNLTNSPFTGATANINKMPLTITGATVASKEYDATNTIATTSVTNVTFKDGNDAVIAATYSVASGSYNNPNAGNDKSTSISITLTGTYATNYSLTNNPYTGATSNITKRPVTITGADITPKRWDGNNSVSAGSLTGVYGTGFISGDDIEITITSTYDNANVGQNKTVNLTNITISGGAQGGNYYLTSTELNNTVTSGIYYEVYFESNGGTTVTTVRNYGTTMSKPTDPTKTNLTFGGWFREQSFANEWIFSTNVVSSNMTLYAKWVCTVYFNTNGGSDFTRTVDIGSKLTAPTVPTKTDWIFDGWFSNASLGESYLWKFDTNTVSTNMTLYAKWVKPVVRIYGISNNSNQAIAVYFVREDFSGMGTLTENDFWRHGRSGVAVLPYSSGRGNRTEASFLSDVLKPAKKTSATDNYRGGHGVNAVRGTNPATDGCIEILVNQGSGGGALQQNGAYYGTDVGGSGTRNFKYIDIDYTRLPPPPVNGGYWVYFRASGGDVGLIFNSSKHDFIGYSDKHLNQTDYPVNDPVGWMVTVQGNCAQLWRFYLSRKLWDKENGYLVRVDNAAYTQQPQTKNTSRPKVLNFDDYGNGTIVIPIGNDQTLSSASILRPEWVLTGKSKSDSNSYLIHTQDQGGSDKTNLLGTNVSSPHEKYFSRASYSNVYSY